MQSEEGDPCRDDKYLEPDIDSIRALKDEVSELFIPDLTSDSLSGLQELERYRRESERRARKLAGQRTKIF